MCMYVCIYIYIYIYICVFKYIYIYMYIATQQLVDRPLPSLPDHQGEASSTTAGVQTFHTYTCVYIYIYTHVYISLSIHVYIYIYTLYVFSLSWCHLECFGDARVCVDMNNQKVFKLLRPVRIARIHCPRFVSRVGLPRSLCLIGSLTAALRFFQGWVRKDTNLGLCYHHYYYYHYYA